MLIWIKALRGMMWKQHDVPWKGSWCNAPALWSSGRVSALTLGGCRFDPQPRQTKDYRNGTHCLALSLQGWTCGGLDQMHTSGCYDHWDLTNCSSFLFYFTFFISNLFLKSVLFNNWFLFRQQRHVAASKCFIRITEMVWSSVFVVLLFPLFSLIAACSAWVFIS